MEVDDSTPTAVRQGGKKKYTIGVNGLSVAREGMEVANPLKDGQSKCTYRIAIYTIKLLEETCITCMLKHFGTQA